MILDIAELAAGQLRDYDARTPGTMFAEEISLSEEQAYVIQSEVCRLREQRGETTVGYKIGCTSPVIQQQLGIDHPIFGRLFSTERHGSGAELSTNQFAGLAVEGELAVRLSEDVRSDCGDRDRFLSCVSSVFPVIELHNHVLRAAHRAASELIANNALHAGFVVPNVDLSLPSSDELSLRITLNGDLAAEVTYIRWQDAVVQAIADLSSLVASHGLSLRADHLVLTGSLAELIPIAVGTRVKVSTLNHGLATATFDC
jgi:2-keto-4-pentenoate hydratase